MDYSATNTTLWNVIIQFGYIAGAILLCNVLRSRVRIVRKSMMPVSVLAGFLLLLLKQVGVLQLNSATLEMLTYHGIALGFIAMSLRVTAGLQANRLTGLRSGAIIVGCYLAQAIVGLTITVGLALTVKPEMFRAAGILLPMGYGQGPGQANNVGQSYEMLGFAGGHSFAMSIAAAGYVCACVVGVLLIRRLARQGKIHPSLRKTANEDLSVGFFQDQGEAPMSDSLDRLSIQLALVLLVYLATYLVTRGITSALSAVSANLAATVNTLLWGFNFIIGAALAILTRTLLGKARKAKWMHHQYQNNYLLNRISGFFFDIMIVAGIATIDPADLSGLWLPFVLMAAAGGVVTWLYLRWVCRRAYPGYYYEGLLSMYGMLTGTISSGVLLLREVDPDFETPAANNLITGSSFAIVFGAPMLVLVGLAPKSNTMTWITLLLCVVYMVAMLLIVLRAGKKRKE